MMCLEIESDKPADRREKFPDSSSRKLSTSSNDSATSTKLSKFRFLRKYLVT